VTTGAGSRWCVEDEPVVQAHLESGKARVEHAPEPLLVVVEEAHGRRRSGAGRGTAYASSSLLYWYRPRGEPIQIWLAAWRRDRFPAGRRDSAAQGRSGMQKNKREQKRPPHRGSSAGGHCPGPGRERAMDVQSGTSGSHGAHVDPDRSISPHHESRSPQVEISEGRGSSPERVPRSHNGINRHDVGAPPEASVPDERRPVGRIEQHARGIHHCQMGRMTRARSPIACARSMRVWKSALFQMHP